MKFRLLRTLTSKVRDLKTQDEYKFFYTVLIFRKIHVKKKVKKFDFSLFFSEKKKKKILIVFIEKFLKP